ncbi:MAG: hypothetical protein AB7E32_15030 [Desulfovibrio sp.]
MKKISILLLLAGLLLLCACALRTAPEPEPATDDSYHRESLVVLGNLHRSAGGCARLEYLVSFPDEEGTAWFRRHKNDVAMSLLEALSMERFEGLGTPGGNEACCARMTVLANAQLLSARGRAELAHFDLH